MSIKKYIMHNTARKNSVRLKNKNIKTFFNKPLIYWTLNFATKINFISKIILSSDSKRYLTMQSILKR